MFDYEKTTVIFDDFKYFIFSFEIVPNYSQSVLYLLFIKKVRGILSIKTRNKHLVE